MDCTPTSHLLPLAPASSYPQLPRAQVSCPVRVKAVFPGSLGGRGVGAGAATAEGRPGLPRVWESPRKLERHREDNSETAVSSISPSETCLKARGWWRPRRGSEPHAAGRQWCGCDAVGHACRLPCHVESEVCALTGAGVWISVEDIVACTGARACVCLPWEPLKLSCTQMQWLRRRCWSVMVCLGL